MGATAWSPKLGGYVADAEAAVGGGVVGVGADERAERLGVEAVPEAVFFGEGVGIGGGVIVHGQQENAVGDGGVRIKGEAVAHGGECVIKLAGVGEDGAEIGMGLGVVGFELDGVAEDGEGLIEEAFQSECGAEILVGARRSGDRWRWRGGRRRWLHQGDLRL